MQTAASSTGTPCLLVVHHACVLTQPDALCARLAMNAAGINAGLVVLV
jgi:hypothetical protein